MRIPLRALDRLAAMLRKTAGEGEFRRIAELLAAAVGRLADLHGRAGQGDAELRDQTRAEVPTLPGWERAASAAGGREEGQAGNGPQAPGPLLILVGEDNPVNQVVVTGMLQRLGRDFDLAVNGREAVEACARRSYDLILMDCEMPVMDGPTAARAIREREAGTGRRAYIAALTALSEMRQVCLESGMDAFLAKPLSPRDLEAVVAEAWRLKEETSLKRT
jgi:CheY-like chemotaxis protein